MLVHKLLRPGQMNFVVSKIGNNPHKIPVSLPISIYYCFSIKAGNNYRETGHSCLFDQSVLLNCTYLIQHHNKRKGLFMIHRIKHITCLILMHVFLFHFIGCGKEEKDLAPAVQQKESSMHGGKVQGMHGTTRPDKEIESAKAAVEANPNDPAVHYNLAVLSDKKGLLDEAEDAYKKATELNPSSEEALVGLGKVLNKKAKSDEAITAFEKALAINPNNAEAYEGLGLVHVHKGGPDEAIRLFNRAVAINPDLIESRYNLGILYAKNGQFEEAIAEWLKAIKINPKRTEFHYNLGIAYTKLGKLEEAIAVWQNALENTEEISSFLYLIGLVYIEKGDVKSAESFLNKALEVDPEFYDVHKVLEELYRSQGMHGEADRHAEIYKSNYSAHH